MIFTDRNPIVGALHKKSDPKSARQARQLAAIAEVTSDIRHIDGKNNLVADTLSRPDNLTKSIPNTGDDDALTPLMPVPICPNCYGAKIHKPTTCSVLKTGINYQLLSQDQSEDQETQHYKTEPTSLKVTEVPWADGHFTVLCDTSLGRPRPIVPASWRRHVFDNVHSLAHPGARTTRKLISSKFVWKEMAAQINR